MFEVQFLSGFSGENCCAATSNFIFHSLYRAELITLLQIFHKMCRCKNFENRWSIFGKDMDNSLRLTVLGHPVYLKYYSPFPFTSPCSSLCVQYTVRSRISWRVVGDSRADM